MKQAIVFLSILITMSAFAYEDDPTALFSTDKNFTKTSKITWLPQTNLQEACERESKKRGMGKFGYSLQACSFWDYEKDGTPVCTIYTKKNASMHSIGHELRHCFQGPWHE